MRRYLGPAAAHCVDDICEIRNKQSEHWNKVLILFCSPSTTVVVGPDGIEVRHSTGSIDFRAAKEQEYS